MILVATFHERLGTASRLRWTIATAAVCFLLCILVAIKVCYQTIIGISKTLQLKATVMLQFPNMKDTLPELKEGQKLLARLDTRNIAGLKLVYLAFWTGLFLLVGFIVGNIH